MTLKELRKKKEQIAALYSSYSGSDLKGMVTDCQSYIDQSSIIRLAKRKRHKPPPHNSQIVVRCEPVSDSITISAIAAELERIWLEDLRFTEEAHALRFSNDDVVLEFVTWWPETGTYVMGEISVDIRAARENSNTLD